MTYRKLILGLLLLWSLPGLGQVSFQFIPEIYGRNINGLFNCHILSVGQRLPVTLKITVSERASGVLCIIKTPEFTIAPGNNPIPLAAVRGAAIQFSDNKLSRLTSMNHDFAEGDYEYCYSLTFTRSDNPPTEQCFSYTLAPFAELSLIDPYNQDKICNQRPLFTWQPLIPGIPGSYYQLVLAEVKDGQNATEALNYNRPIINQTSIIAPMLPYPSIAKALESKKKYAWQVTAYKDQTVLNRSDIWTFTLDCQDSVKVIADNGYRRLEDLLKGNYYLAVGSVKFALVNPYVAQNLKYEIKALRNPDKKIKRLPTIKLVNGQNNITINLADAGSFNDGDYYILSVRLPDGSNKSLRFQYKDAR